MNIILNGEPSQVEAEKISEALIELGYGNSRVATAVNSEFVPESLRAQTRLSENDRLEVLAPMQGG